MKQEIFNFSIKETLAEDNYFVSQSNFIAHKLLLSEKKSKRFIYLKGSAKSGKTHLGKLWKKNNNALLFRYNNFNEIIVQNKHIFIDDLTINLDEEKIFHLINHCNNNNLKILITSNIFPSEYNFMIEDLSSRLKTFITVEIFEPDDELIYNLLIKHLSDRQLNIYNQEILSFIIKRINRTYLDIYNIVEKLDKLSLSKKKQITVPLIKELL